jgi:hypothetical protein
MAAKDCDVLTTLLIDVLHSYSNPEFFKYISCGCADVAASMDFDPRAST